MTNLIPSDKPQGWLGIDDFLKMNPGLATVSTDR